MCDLLTGHLASFNDRVGKEANPMLLHYLHYYALTYPTLAPNFHRRSGELKVSIRHLHILLSLCVETAHDNHITYKMFFESVFYIQ